MCIYSNFKKISSCCLLLTAIWLGPVMAQVYTTNRNAHSHNDYLQKQPFYTAYANRLGSIEIDVFLKDGQLYVAHEEVDIDKQRTIEKLYLQPLIEQVALNGGKLYPDSGTLQFLIDLKTDGETTLRALEKQLQPIRHYFDLEHNQEAVRLVISGSQPLPHRFKEFDTIFYFDGRPGVDYSGDELKRVAFFSTALQRFTTWNGLGRIPEPELLRVKGFVDSVHHLGKPVRFWGNPDTKTCWQAFIKIGVDYINTDSPAELARFLDRYPRSSYTSKGNHIPYKPTYKSDGTYVKPKKVILLISDGAGFNQQWAAATANGGYLNMTQFRHIGFQNTAPVDDYNTDSAAGATAFGTGKKTRNRYIGTDSIGQPLENLPEKLIKLGIASGIVTNDGIVGATPSSFYAHVTERNHADSIAQFLLTSPVSLFIGAYSERFWKDNDKLIGQLKEKSFEIGHGIDQLRAIPSNKKAFCFANDDLGKDYRMLEDAFDVAVDRMSKQGDGFFLVVEGAKIDGGGHGNNIRQCIDEYLSFDRVLGKALAFADQDGETLIVVTSDHETGGMVLIDGDYQKGFVLGEFTTNDHTGAPIPIYSYGPGSRKFTGFMQNSDIGARIFEAMKGD